MSNLSDIGFPVQNEQDVNVLITETIKYVESIRCPQGFYLRFADASGAEIYLQGNPEQELIGFNPHYDGKSRKKVSLTKAIERDSSELDGGFHVWANPKNDDAESGEYQFVFDAPDFRTIGEIDFPKICEIQLTAFASNDFKVFRGEVDFYYVQDAEAQMSAKSFFPSGLFLTKDETIATETPRPIGIFAGEIKEFELKTNELSNENFYWFLVETVGGEIDVVADVKLVPNKPNIGGIVSGQFWLSGRVINLSE
ncbi:MAG: hypothetical protein H0W58_02835 [Acidobacteria bacterium]|jgi:hypothetical protein|nr:hypothetical protein [Acidobacteriota bacterium]